MRRWSARNRNGTMTHRFFLATAALLGCRAAAFGQGADYPTRQITIIVAVAADSQADQFARPMTEPLRWDDVIRSNNLVVQ
jgi:tripartite-type tricarboxylate transporter receptor subunit TctC